MMNSINAMKGLTTLLANTAVKMHLIVFLMMFIGLMPQSVFAAQIHVSVDRNPVSLDESFQIIFTATEEPDDDPDFSPLEQDFSILSQSTSSSSTWINGKSSKSVQWTLTVMAKNSGSLIIPPVQFGDDVSETATILVASGATNKTLKNDEDLFMEVEATPENPYIQSQVLYTLRLYTRVDIAQARLNEPELADAVIEKLGEDSTYTTQVKGVDYSVTERKYAIFPQKSGSVTIKPLVLTAEVLTNNRRGFNSFFSSPITKTRRVESRAVTLEVKPAPATFTGTHWLSAQQLNLSQQWSGDFTQMKVGEPLTRTLTLSVKGATVGQLPELNAASAEGADEQLKAYPDQPVLQEQKKPEGLTAFRQEKIALMPSKAGSYTLPAIEIPWFNTQSQKMEIARIPETTITAMELPGTQPGTIAPDTPKAVSPPVLNQEPLSKQPAAVNQPQPQENTIWLWISAFLALGWLMTVILFFTKRPAKKPVIESNQTDTSLKDCIKNLKKACDHNDAIAAKNALLEWGRLQFIARDGVYAASQSGTGAAIARDGVYAASQPGASATNSVSLGAIAGFCEARLRDEILHLNQVLYGKEKGQWNGKKLFQTFTENKARAKLAASGDKSLEPLYRL
ncbi:MAG: BatD family protein [Methylococcaceae bacterium]